MSTINTDPDPFSFLGAPTHTFIWKDGEKVDLGTLGGPDAFVAAGCVNQRQGLVVGRSLTSSIPDPIAGSPPQDPFLWENGTMLDLGSLGGNFGSRSAGITEAKSSVYRVSPKTLSLVLRGSPAVIHFYGSAECSRT